MEDHVPQPITPTDIKTITLNHITEIINYITSTPEWRHNHETTADPTPLEITLNKLAILHMNLYYNYTNPTTNKTKNKHKK